MGQPSEHWERAGAGPASAKFSCPWPNNDGLCRVLMVIERQLHWNLIDPVSWIRTRTAFQAPLGWAGNEISMKQALPDTAKPSFGFLLSFFRAPIARECLVVLFPSPCILSFFTLFSLPFSFLFFFSPSLSRVNEIASLP